MNQSSATFTPIVEGGVSRPAKKSPARLCSTRWFDVFGALVRSRQRERRSALARRRGATTHASGRSEAGGADHVDALAADGDGEALAFSPDGALLAVANRYEVMLLDGRTGAEVGKVDLAHAGGLAFSADGSKLAVSTGGEAAAVQFVDVASRTVTSSVPIRWKRGMFGFETDEAGALVFEGNESVLFLAKWRGVLLRVAPSK